VCPPADPEWTCLTGRQIRASPGTFLGLPDRSPARGDDGHHGSAEVSEVGQVVQLVGALIVLAAFVANQRFDLSSDALVYLAANAVGTAILAVAAGVNGELGFVLLEGVWAIVSCGSIVRAVRARRSAAVG
jgi:hypothetical protein